MDGAPRIAFDNSYAQLPERFYVRQQPHVWPDPMLALFNQALAETLGLDVSGLDDDALAQTFSGNAPPEGAEPLAMAYAGHQFGGFSPQLGDGRALLLGEVVGSDGVRRDIQLKGSGQTPFSRMGDGRAAIGPVLREYIVAEAMAALGIPTTRALAAVTTGDVVLRETKLPGAVLTRVARSHVRVGTFQFFAVRGDVDGVRALADYVIARHYPAAADADARYAALLDAVVEAQASLVSQWMGIGFIHGVMNTDNMSIVGETIDYGPCAFMDDYDPATVYSSIDAHGRYAYQNQPPIAGWNLARFAETLLPLLGADQDAQIAAAQAAIDRYPGLYADKRRAVFAAKLGIVDATAEDDALIDGFLMLMAAAKADFTNTFRALTDAPKTLRAALGDGFVDWSTRRRARLGGNDDAASARMRGVNPAVIPRNHQVEGALDAATREGDLGPTMALLAALAKPFAAPADPSYTAPPAAHEVVQATFCGT